jgi:hypothetical protein
VWNGPIQKKNLIVNTELVTISSKTQPQFDLQNSKIFIIQRIQPHVHTVSAVLFQLCWLSDLTKMTSDNLSIWFRSFIKNDIDPPNICKFWKRMLQLLSRKSISS